MTNAPTLTKVAECLYRNGRGTYFALLKVRGKQIKKSLKTEDSALARRRLVELKTEASGLADEGRGMTFDDLATRWLAYKKSDLREGSWIATSELRGAGQSWRRVEGRSLRGGLHRWMPRRAPSARWLLPVGQRL